MGHHFLHLQALCCLLPPLLPLLLCSTFCWGAHQLARTSLWTFSNALDSVHLCSQHCRDPPLWDNLTSLQPPTAPQESWSSSSFHTSHHQEISSAASEESREKLPLPQSIGSDSIPGPRISASSRRRCLLLQALINSLRRVIVGKLKPGHGACEFTKILQTWSKS